MRHMKKTSNILILFFTLLISVKSNAQLVYQDIGDLKMLGNQTKLMVKYDYSEMMMSEGSTEAVYLEKMRKQLNESVPGKGDEFIASWESYKKEGWPYKFEELWNKYFGKLNLSQSNTDVAYTLTVKTLVVFPGQFSSGGIGAIPAWITCEFIITETNKPDVILSKSTIKHVQGGAMCSTANSGICVEGAFAKIAKSFVEHIKKNKK